MKLRNKKTGEIGEVGYLATSDGKIIVNHIDDQDEWYEYDSLTELNEEWEDYKEPNEYWYIYTDKPQRADCGDILEEDFETIGNYFETKEEAEKAVEKLKAWKRLKDKGFSFTSFEHIGANGWVKGVVKFILVQHMLNDEAEKDLDLLFGGEE